MKHIACQMLMTLAVCTCMAFAADPADDKFVALFDGQSLDGWERVGNAESVWEVKDGAICGSGQASMLVPSSSMIRAARLRSEKSK